MRYYEIVFMVRPDCGDKISSMIDYCSSIVTNSKGEICRMEDWGCRNLAYPIKRCHKAYYVLLNVKASKIIINELNNIFRFNTIILRSIIMRTKLEVFKPSPMINNKDDIMKERVDDIK